MTLLKYDMACQELAEAASLDEVKNVTDRLKAWEHYAKQAHNPELEANAWMIRKRAEDKLGELSLELEKAHKVGPGIDIQLPAGGKSKKDVLSSFGISTSAAQRYEQFHMLPEWEKRAVIKAGREAIMSGKSIAEIYAIQQYKKRRRDLREVELGKRIMALPKTKFGVIVADPEWRFEPWSRETGSDRSADNHYPTSQLQDIKTRDVASIAADDCALFLWATQPMLRQALDVMETWGFEYKSNAIWVKDRIGTGYWFRNQHEQLLLGTRGDIPCPWPGDQWWSVWEEARRGHSAKPDYFLELIEAYFPNLPKIELNRRGPARRGWSAWGLEAEPTKDHGSAVECRA